MSNGTCCPEKVWRLLLGGIHKLSNTPGQAALGGPAGTGGDWARWPGQVPSKLNHAVIVQRERLSTAGNSFKEGVRCQLPEEKNQLPWEEQTGA